MHVLLQYQSKVITLSGRRFITVSGGFITLSGSYYSIGRFYYIIGQLLQYRAFITLSVGTDATTLGMSLMKQTNRSDPNTLPWGMPLVTLAHIDLLLATAREECIDHCSTVPPIYFNINLLKINENFVYSNFLTH